MRILTGFLKGRVLSFKPNPHLRPTSDKARQAIFNTLVGRIEGSRVLDLFSGTGALGFEALSSGAEKVVFVEKDKTQAHRIVETLKTLGLEGKALVRNADALKCIEALSREEPPYDLVFADPPYEKGLALAALEALSRTGLLGAGSLVILECSKREKMPERCGDLGAVKTAVYGDAQVVWYARKGSA